jgi:hypothetical protein
MRKWTLLFVLFFLATGGTASADLSLYGPSLYTENIGPNGAGFSEGWFLSVNTLVDDSKGVPGNITSITASQAGGANFLHLDYFSKLPFFPYWGADNSRERYSLNGPTGQWTITASNADGDVVSVSTHTLDRTAMVPTTAVWFKQYPDGKWFVEWDFTPFKTYTYGVDQIEIRVLRSPEDQLFRLLFTLGDPNPDKIWSVEVPPGVLALNEPLWFRIIARDQDKSESGSPVENRSSSFGFFNPNPVAGFETLECQGFGAPMDKVSVNVKNHRVLPLKVQLFHADGAPVIGSDLLAPPVLRVTYIPSSPGPVENVTEYVLPVGLGTEDSFVFTDEGKWQYNLSTSNYTASGEYILAIQTGDSSEYVINPGCITTFVIK